MFYLLSAFSHHLKVIINAFFLHKFIVAALFNKTFVVEYENGFCVANGAKAVSNGEDGSSFGKTFKALLNHSFAFVIKSGSGFVKNEHRWVFKENACDGNSLFLSAGKFNSAFAYVSVITVFKGGNEFVCAGKFCGFNNFFAGRVGFSVKDVFKNASAEEINVLLNNTDL